LALSVAAQAQGQETRCKVDSWQFAHNQTVPITAAMPNDRKPCTIRKITFQGGSVADYSVSRPPAHGDVVIKKNEAFYTPKAGFSGVDKFVLGVTGKNPYVQPTTRSGLLEVTVTVAAP